MGERLQGGFTERNWRVPTDLTLSSLLLAKTLYLHLKPCLGFRSFALTCNQVTQMRKSNGKNQKTQPLGVKPPNEEPLHLYLGVRINLCGTLSQRIVSIAGSLIYSVLGAGKLRCYHLLHKVPVRIEWDNSNYPSFFTWFWICCL